MRFFKIKLTPIEDPELCILRDDPEGIGLNRYKFSRGEAFEGEYPEDCRVFMSKKEQGTKLASLIGNTRTMLVVHRAVKDIVEAMNQGPTEYLPLSIYNHKKRLASAEYFILHPVGAWDCLDLEGSEITYLKDQVVAVDRMALDPEKLKNVPDLFRVKEDPSVYLISERLLEKLQSADFELTNFYTTPVPIAKD